MKLTVNGEEFTYDYSVGDVVSDAQEIQVGDKIEASDYASMVFNGIEYTDDVVPSDTSGVYSHYEVDNASNTYLVVKFDITNYMNDKRDGDTFVGAKAVYMEKYSYNGFIVVEDEDGKGFSSHGAISPLTTRHVYHVISVPKTVKDSDVVVTIFFNNQEYVFAG